MSAPLLPRWPSLGRRLLVELIRWTAVLLCWGGTATQGRTLLQCFLLSIAGIVAGSIVGSVATFALRQPYDVGDWEIGSAGRFYRCLKYGRLPKTDAPFAFHHPSGDGTTRDLVVQFYGGNETQLVFQLSPSATSREATMLVRGLPRLLAVNLATARALIKRMPAAQLTVSHPLIGQLVGLSNCPAANEPTWCGFALAGVPARVSLLKPPRRFQRELTAAYRRHFEWRVERAWSYSRCELDLLLLGQEDTSLDTGVSEDDPDTGHLIPV